MIATYTNNIVRILIIKVLTSRVIQLPRAVLRYGRNVRSVYGEGDVIHTGIVSRQLVSFRHLFELPGPCETDLHNFYVWRKSCCYYETTARWYFSCVRTHEIRVEPMQLLSFQIPNYHVRFCGTGHQKFTIAGNTETDYVIFVSLEKCK